MLRITSKRFHCVESFSPVNNVRFGKKDRQAPIPQLTRIPSAKSSLLGLYSPHGSGVTHAHRLNVQDFSSNPKTYLKTKIFGWTQNSIPRLATISKSSVCEGYGVLQNHGFRSSLRASQRILRVEGPCQVPASNGTWCLPEKKIPLMQDPHGTTINSNADQLNEENGRF